MRTFNFKARNIGQEKYLTYTMGEECELDEDVLDYCEENTPEELLPIIYEEDDDYDYLTYDITDKTSLEQYISVTIDCPSVLFVLRNVAIELISLKEQAIPLSYVLLNRNFIYIDLETRALSFICLPIESKGSLAVEFKSFVRQLLANMKYDVDEDLNYVGKLLTYINGDSFNLRGLIGLAEALMEEAGISFEEAGAIEADGVEVVSAEEPQNTGAADFMNNLDDADNAPLPEIGDDEEEEEAEEEAAEDKEELDSILPAGMTVPPAEEVEAPAAEAPAEQTAEAPAAEAPVEQAKEAPAAEAPAEQAKEAPAAEAPAEQTAKVAAEQAEEAPAAETPAEQAKEAPAAEAPAEQAKETPVEEAPAEKTSKAKTETKIEEIPTVEEAPAETEAKPIAEEKIEMKPQKKESDIDTIKGRIKELVGEVPSAKPVGADGKSVSNISDVNSYMGGRPPMVKKNVVKVSRAAIIQQTEAEMKAEKEAEEKANGLTENIKVPVIEDIYDGMNVEDKEKEDKPKSNSVLSKTVAEVAKTVKGQTSTLPKALPYLVRVSTEERIMLSKTTFKIGKATRGVDYTVGGNGAISRQHAIITQKDGVCYIKDNKSTNHTYINGKVIEDGVEEILTHDSMIRLADEEFVFKIR